MKEKTKKNHSHQKPKKEMVNQNPNPTHNLKNMSKGLNIIYGLHAAQAALENPNRVIKKVIISASVQGKVKALYDHLFQSQKSHKFELIEVSHKDLDDFLGADKVHQGIVVLAQGLPSSSLEDILDQDDALIMVLDQAQDPRNIGAVLRSCAAFGAKALIMPEKKSAPNSSTLMKSAAGAFEMVPIIRVANLSRSLEQMKKSGYWLVGLDGQAQDHLSQISVSGKRAIIMGAEGEGLRRLTLEACDFLAKIPMDPQMESLNLSVAASIALYEMSQK